MASGELGRLADDAHSLAAAARRRLDTTGDRERIRVRGRERGDFFEGARGGGLPRRHSRRAALRLPSSPFKEIFSFLSLPLPLDQRAGTTGTPAAFILSLEEILLPIASIASGGGPIQTSPAASTARAKPAFSERNP